jgi:hypothetical protein
VLDAPELPLELPLLPPLVLPLELLVLPLELPLDPPPDEPPSANPVSGSFAHATRPMAADATVNPARTKAVRMSVLLAVGARP